MAVLQSRFYTASSTLARIRFGMTTEVLRVVQRRDNEERREVPRTFRLKLNGSMWAEHAKPHLSVSVEH
jgi:hypothetical protein